MLAQQKLAWLGASAFLGYTATRGFHAYAATRTNRVYTSIRQEWEFNQLLSSPSPLLANFCMLTDAKSKSVSSALENVVNSGETAVPVRSVDVEVDEPGTRDLLQRYLVSHIPTIIALEGGEQILRLEPKASEVEALETEIREWITQLK